MKIFYHILILLFFVLFLTELYQASVFSKIIRIKSFMRDIRISGHAIAIILWYVMD